MPLRLHYIILILVLIFLTSVSKNSVRDQQKDFAVFKSVLLKKEGRLDLHGPSSEVLNHLERVETLFKTELSPLDQFKYYASTLSLIQCGHTQIHPTKDVLREWLATRNSLPIDFYLIGKRLIVNKRLGDDDSYVHDGKSSYEQVKNIQAGAEILMIDGLTVPQMMEEISPYMSSDENSIDFKYFQASQLFDFYRHMASPFTKDSVVVQYVYGADTSEIYFATGTAPVLTMNARLKKNEEEFKIQESNFGSFKIAQKCGYFRFESFKIAHGKNYDAFLEQSFKKLKLKKIDKLIVDLRGNTGGAMQYSFMRYIVGEGVTLGRYVIEKPKSGIENGHLKKMNSDYLKHKRMSRIQRRMIRKENFNDGIIQTKMVDESLIFDGEIVVITDEGTFSSAAILACHLKTMADAKIIGRTAGGSFYAGNAGTLLLELPKSKMKMFVNPNTFYSHLPQVEDPLAIKQPDIELHPLIVKKRDQDQYYFKQAKNAF
ncbi:MAG: S41 family peptidase [Crocinitomicaceae bacterium]|nr:S41 family peptidase [Crocinitomicaceae bacterium]